MENYYFKYLKYKNKYIKLLEQNAGSQPKTEKFIHNCFIDGYKQHIGECWNDSIQTIFTFSYPFQELQKKALSKTSDGSFLTGREIVSASFRNKQNLLPLHLVTKSDNTNFRTLIEPYIDRLLIRFRQVYSKNNPQIQFSKQKDDETLSITCALNALEFSEINKKIKTLANRKKHGSYDYHEILSIHSLSFVLLPNEKFINFHMYKNEKMICYKPIDDIVTSNQDYFALQLGSRGHAFNVYTCPQNKMYFYDDENTTSIEFDWVNYFKKNIKFKDFKNNEFILKDIPDSNKWKFSLALCKHPFFICNKEYCESDKYDSGLCYYNKETNKILVVNKTINEYIMFNYIDINSKDYDKKKSLEENDILGIKCDELTNIFGLFISTATTRDDYKLQLEHLNYFLYNNNYNLPDVKKFILEKFSCDNMDYASEYIYNSFILEDNNLIKKLYENENYKERFKEINSLTQKPYYYDFDRAFINLSQYNTFMREFAIQNNFEFISNVISLNINKFDTSYVCIEVFKKNYQKTDFKTYFNSSFNDIFEQLTDNFSNDELSNSANLELIKYFIENNISNIFEKDFEINHYTGKLLHYLVWSYSNNNPLLLGNIFDYLSNNWKKDYKTLFDSKDKFGDSILYEILLIRDTYNFKKILNILYNLQKIGEIDVFYNKSNNNEEFLFYDISDLSKESLDEFIKIIDLVFKKEFLKKLIKKKNKNNYNVIEIQQGYKNSNNFIKYLKSKL
jgi:hypothetical protein